MPVANDAKIDQSRCEQKKSRNYTGFKLARHSALRRSDPPECPFITQGRVKRHLERGGFNLQARHVDRAHNHLPVCEKQY